MKKDQLQVAKQIKTLFLQARQALKINRDQPEARIMFDMLDGIDRASVMLNSAWKLSEKHHITDPAMRKEFVDMFSYFGKVRKELTQEFKQKH
ncbi:hypothetical protein GYA49_02885 [Candidatus Beckwithbacteria bacterium]|nr:hypothetical protein [Candidatus Beckwithbacteria bacterium]